MVLGWRLKQWKTLPEAGGWFDQPLETMTRVETALNAYDAFDTRRRMKATDFARDYPTWAEFCFEVDEWEV